MFIFRRYEYDQYFLSCTPLFRFESRNSRTTVPGKIGKALPMGIRAPTSGSQVATQSEAPADTKRSLTVLSYRDHLTMFGCRSLARVDKDCN